MSNGTKPLAHAPASEAVWDGGADTSACSPYGSFVLTVASPDDVTCPECRELLWLDGDPFEVGDQS